MSLILTHSYKNGKVIRMDNLFKTQALQEIDKSADLFCRVSDAIFDAPETAFQEHTAARLMCEALEAEGFSVQRGLAGMDTAFAASFGSGSPTIGILAEYGALSNMSQQAGLLEPSPVQKGAPGRACGHNLLGGGVMAAAVAVKRYLEASGTAGTVICYGCPGEEGGSGKAFMARDGVFDQLDCALTWHPSTINMSSPASTLANYQVSFRFRGTAAHAAHLGRSALDALELMTTGIQYLREHIIPEARIHYAITNAGGAAPNVVQSEAEIVYLIRAPHANQVEEIYQRVQKVAQGAALMTETGVEETGFKASYNVLPNHTLGAVMGDNLLALGAPTCTQEEWDWARAMCDTIQRPNRLFQTAAGMMGPKGAGFVSAYQDKAICDAALPYVPVQYVLPSSSDVGDVSWVCPTAQIGAATMCAGTPGHSWQLTAQGKSSIAHKGMLLAGKVIAGTAIDLLCHPEILVKAKEEHTKTLDGGGYRPLILQNIGPLDVLGEPDA